MPLKNDTRKRPAAGYKGTERDIEEGRR